MSEPLQGLRILIVEDEAMIAMLAEDMLDMGGATVVGIAATLADGRIAVERDDFDLAMLDVNLGGELSSELAARLKERRKPFLFTTGYGSEGLDPIHEDVPVLSKPYVINDLHAAIAALMGQAGTSSSTSISDSNRG